MAAGIDTRRTTITVRTSVVELGLYGDEYEAFAAAMRAEGYAVDIEEPPEYRSAGRVAVEAGIWIWEHPTEAAALTVVVDAIRRAAASTISRAKKGRRKQRLRRLPIYGSNDQIHAWVELPDDDDHGATDER